MMRKIEIDVWNPETDTVQKLLGIIKEDENATDFNPDDPYDLSFLPTATKYQRFVDEYCNWEIWTIDYLGNALVGESADSIRSVYDLIIYRIYSWDPENDTVEELCELCHELRWELEYEPNYFWELNNISVAKGYENFVEEFSSYPVWTVDYRGDALVGKDCRIIIPTWILLEIVKNDKKNCS